MGYFFTAKMTTTTARMAPPINIHGSHDERLKLPEAVPVAEVLPAAATCAAEGVLRPVKILPADPARLLTKSPIPESVSELEESVESTGLPFSWKRRSRFSKP
jgi:hypothetical protein